MNKEDKAIYAQILKSENDLREQLSEEGFDVKEIIFKRTKIIVYVIFKTDLSILKGKIIYPMKSFIEYIKNYKKTENEIDS